MVVHGAGDIAPETCMALVRETSLTECTFLEPSEVADVKVRYFLADREVDFAGHPTIASVLAWCKETGTSPDELALETGAGIIPIRLRDNRVTMSTAKPQFGAEVPRGDVAEIFGLAPGDITATPQIVSVGLGHTIAFVGSLDALRAATADRAKLVEFCHANTWPGLAEAPAPFLVHVGGLKHGGTFSRLFLETGGASEDAFTGSATAEAAAYLFARGLIAPDFIAEQGHWMGRPGFAKVQVHGQPGKIASVDITGAGHVLMQGQLSL